MLSAFGARWGRGATCEGGAGVWKGGNEGLEADVAGDEGNGGNGLFASGVLGPAA